MLRNKPSCGAPKALVASEPRLTNHHSSLFGNIWFWRSTLVKIEGWSKITVKIEKNHMFDSFPNGEDIEYELDTVSFNPA